MHYSISQQLQDNPLLNGNFDVWSDVTTIAAAGFIGVSWSVEALGTAGVATINQQAFVAGQSVWSNIPGATLGVEGEPIWFMRWNQTTAATAGTPALANHMEDVRTFAGMKNVTLQGFYRCNQFVTPALSQFFGSGGSPSATVAIAASNAPAGLPPTVDQFGVTQWRPFAVEFAVPSLSGKTIGTTANTSYLAARFVFPLNVLFQFDLSAVALTPQGVRIPLARRRRLTEEAELLKRYYDAYSVWAPVSTQSPNGVLHRRAMRAAPTITPTGGTAANITADGYSIISAGAAAQVAVTVDARL